MTTWFKAVVPERYMCIWLSNWFTVNIFCSVIKFYVMKTIEAINFICIITVGLQMVLKPAMNFIFRQPPCSFEKKHIQTRFHVNGTGKGIIIFLCKWVLYFVIKYLMLCFVWQWQPITAYTSSGFNAHLCFSDSGGVGAGSGGYVQTRSKRMYDSGSSCAPISMYSRNTLIAQFPSTQEGVTLSVVNQPESRHRPRYYYHILPYVAMLKTVIISSNRQTLIELETLFSILFLLSRSKLEKCCLYFCRFKYVSCHLMNPLPITG